MLNMILKMSGVTALYVLLTMLLWKRVRGKRLKLPGKLSIGLIYGLCAVLSTHFGVDYGHMMLNVRDIGPLAAGLFFDPLSGILAGLIGGVERYIVGTYFGVGSFTRVACSVSTCLAGFLSALMHIKLFKRKKPSVLYAFFMGAVMEVFHMYVVLITHRDDMTMALYVVKICSGPMIMFTGLGLALSSMMLRITSGEWKNPFRHIDKEEIPVSQKFQSWLFAVTLVVLVLNLQFAYVLQTQSAVQDARNSLIRVSGDVLAAREKEIADGADATAIYDKLFSFRVGNSGSIDILDGSGQVRAGNHKGKRLPKATGAYVKCLDKNGFFTEHLFATEVIGRINDLDDGTYLLTLLPTDEVYADRDAQTLETVYADILLFTVIYVLISMLVQQIVVNNLAMVNASLTRITGGDLNEVVNVRESSEFASLSDDINQTVDVLKGYIEAAEKRIEQELEFARTIQDSALPKNFNFPRNDFDLYATMDPAKEVGGDFYDFFFIDSNRLALVIADVSGKGIPAALFMMRSKTAIRGLAEGGSTPSEILFRANNTLCEGNEAEMFVTVWLGIIDLTTGLMRCASAGHEYPVLMRAGGDFELLKDKHGLALAAMEGVRFREYELQMNPGDKLFVYTDGIPEAIDEQVVQYGVDRLTRALNAVKDEPMALVLPAVRADIAEFVGGADQFDDITMLGFAYRGPEKGAANEGTDA